MRNSKIGSLGLGVCTVVIAGLAIVTILRYLPKESLEHNNYRDVAQEDEDEWEYTRMDDAHIVQEGEVIQTEFYPPDNTMDTPLYVYDEPSIGTTSTRPESYGSQDKIGIERRVMNASVDRLDDFEFIRDDIQARDAFMLNLTGEARQPNRHWHTNVVERKNNQIVALASRGNSVGESTRFGIVIHGHFDGGIAEIWQLNPVGTTPTLILRSDDHNDIPDEPWDFPHDAL